jgi:hypothetical protein
MKTSKKPIAMIFMVTTARFVLIFQYMATFFTIANGSGTNQDAKN